MGTGAVAAGADTARFKEEQRRDWSDARVVSSSRDLHPKTVAQTRALTEAIIQAAQIREGMRVLDLASGSGDPALGIAALVAPEGHVTATDLSPGMVEAAEENARGQGLTNVICRVADAEDLPFADESFDAVTCRLGLMYCPDPGMALREVWRVLRPGGRAAFVAWGPADEHAGFATLIEVFMEYAYLPPCEVGAPTPFVFGRAGTLARRMEQAGFREIKEEPRKVLLPWPGTPEDFWQSIRAAAPPLRPILESLPPEQEEHVVRELLVAFGRYHDGEHVTIPATIIVGSGLR